jgi:hypothetical protein
MKSAFYFTSATQRRRGESVTDRGIEKGNGACAANVGMEDGMEQELQIIEERTLPLAESTSFLKEDTTAMQQVQERLKARKQEIFKLSHQIKLHRRWHRITMASIVFSMFVLVGMTEMPFLSAVPWYFLLWVQIPLMSLALFLMGYYLLRAMQAVESLKQMQDIWSVGALIEAYASDDAVGGDAMEALTGLLRRMQASDASLLTERHHKLLCQALKRSGGAKFLFLPVVRKRNRMFAFAILKAFEQVGTRQAIPVVEYLMQKSPNLEVRRAAEECLPFLQTRAQQELNEQTLLRASTSGGLATEELLRPASGQSEVKPQQLLRSSTLSSPTI